MWGMGGLSERNELSVSGLSERSELCRSGLSERSELSVSAHSEQSEPETPTNPPPQYNNIKQLIRLSLLTVLPQNQNTCT